MVDTVLIETRFKPNVGWWLDVYPDEDPDFVSRPEDCFYPSEQSARVAGERYAALYRHHLDRSIRPTIRHRRGPEIPSYA